MLPHGEIAYSDLGSAAALSADEVDFVLRLRANEDGAYDQLVRMYHAVIYHVSCRMLADPAEAADVTQDIFVKVFKNIGRFRGESSLKTWIFKIAFSEIHNRLRWARRRHRQSMVPLDPDDGAGDRRNGNVAFQVPDEGPTPEAALVQKERETAIREALLKLSREHRSIVVLRDIQGFSYEEITEILGISMGTMKSRLARARAELKKCLMRYLSVQRVGG